MIHGCRVFVSHQGKQLDYQVGEFVVGSIDRRRRRIFSGSGNHVIHAVRNLQERCGLGLLVPEHFEDSFVAAGKQEKFRYGHGIAECAPTSLRGNAGRNANGLKPGALVKPYLFHGPGLW